VLAADSFALAYAASAALTVAVLAIVWPRRHAPGGIELARVLVAVAFWAACDAIELQVPTLAGKQLVAQLQYIGVVSAAPLFFHAARVLSGHGARVSTLGLALVWTVPLLSLVCAWTNNWHHWLWTEIVAPSGNSPFAVYRYGWWIWVLVTHQYIVMVAATVLLLLGTRRVAQQFRPAMIVMLIAVLLPWIGNAAYTLKLGPWPGLNWLTLSLGVSASLLAWVVLREGLLDLLPQAREALLETQRGTGSAEGGLAPEVRRGDDQRAAVPAAAGVADVGADGGRDVRPAIHRHDAWLVHHLHDEDRVLGSLHDLDAVVVGPGDEGGAGVQADDTAVDKRP